MTQLDQKALVAQCINKTMILQKMSGGWLVILLVVLLVTAPVFILAMNFYQADECKYDWFTSNGLSSFSQAGDKSREMDKAATSTATATATLGGESGNKDKDGDVDVNKDGEEEIDDRPPRYENASASTSTGTSATVPEPIITTTTLPRSPAETFVRTTIYLLVLLLILFLLALFIQFFTYCADKLDVKTGKQVIIIRSDVWRGVWWTFYGILCAFATSAVLCWAISLRELWGKGARERVPIDPHFVWWSLCLAVGAVAMGPLIVIVCAYGLSVRAVEWCQVRCCGVGEGGDEDEELANLEEGRGEREQRVGVELGGDDEEDGEGESAALMKGHAKS